MSKDVLRTHDASTLSDPEQHLSDKGIGLATTIIEHAPYVRRPSCPEITNPHHVPSTSTPQHTSFDLVRSKHLKG